MKQRTRRLPRARAVIAIVACGLAASMVSGAAGADDLFTAPWLGFNAGSSAYPGNPQPFERDPTALATADFNGDGVKDIGTLTSDVYGLGLSAALTILPGTEAASSLIFQDGFGSGDTSTWSATVP